MDKEQIIDGLKFTIGMFLLDPITNETMTKEQLNDMGRTTVDACEGAIEILLAIPQDHDGCKDCKHELKSNGEYPCSYCKQNYKDMWEMKEPTDTITMTREEFSEKLMEHYCQGRADEKAYRNGDIMQSFNPD